MAMNVKTLKATLKALREFGVLQYKDENIEIILGTEVSPSRSFNMSQYDTDDDDDDVKSNGSGNVDEMRDLWWSASNE